MTAPEPLRDPVMLQRWEQLTFLHWQYDPAAVRPLVPSTLELDLFAGAAWVGLVPFRITGTRLPSAPALPWLSNFPETNLRTYVRGVDGYPGVWFFSLEAARLLAVLAARYFYGLPYMWAHMEVESSPGLVRYKSWRKWPEPRGAGTDIHIHIAEPFTPSELTDLDVFLTARWRLYSLLAGRLAFARIEHPPWPLRKAQAGKLNETLRSAAGLSRTQAAPLVHYADAVQVRIARPAFQ